MKCTKCGAQAEPSDVFCNQCGAQLGEDFLIENGVLKQYQGHERELVVPHGVTKIAPMVFAQKYLRQITLPKGLAQIGHHAFAETELETVTIPANVRTIGEGAFYGCRLLKNVDIKAGTEQIDNAVFFDCVSLKNITIPNSVKKIGEMVFQGCSSLTILRFPDSVQEIGQAACINCTNLKTVHIPEGLQSIPANMFECCEGLTSVTIPSQAIGIGAFLNCTSLHIVRLPRRLQRIEKAAFKGCDRINRVQYDGSPAEKDALVIAPGNETLTNAANWKYEQDKTDNTPKQPENEKNAWDQETVEIIHRNCDPRDMLERFDSELARRIAESRETSGKTYRETQQIPNPQSCMVKKSRCSNPKRNHPPFGRTRGLPARDATAISAKTGFAADAD